MGVTRYLNRIPQAALAALTASPIVLELLTELGGDVAALRACIDDPHFDPNDAWGATKEDLAAFVASPGVAELRCAMEPYEDFDKSWAGIQFVLTGHPLELALAGARELAGTGSLVAPRVLDVSEVAAVAAALEEIAPDDFRERIDLAALAAARVYPEMWDEKDAIEYLVSYYESLRELYRDAADDGDAVLVRTSV